MDAPEPALSPAREFREGLRDILPIFIAAAAIAMLFGALSVAKGLSIAETGLMSLIVFAGGAQFAAIELWTWPVPVLALALSTLLINSRHLLMGASLAPKLAGFSLLQKLAGFYCLVDESWALGERRAQSRPVTPAYWLGLAVPLPVAWVGATLVGAWLGSLAGDPSRFGADFAFAALFIGLVAGFWKGPRSGMTVAAAGAASALVYVLAGPPWHVAAGAFAGILAAYLSAPREAAET
jgi:4-azaleucine resistance transporter AzlC